MSGMSKPSVPNRSGSGKSDDRFFGTIGKNQPSVGPTGRVEKSSPERLFGTIGDEGVGENEPGISAVDATKSRNLTGMPKRVNDNPGSISGRK